MRIRDGSAPDEAAGEGCAAADRRKCRITVAEAPAAAANASPSTFVWTRERHALQQAAAIGA